MRRDLDTVYYILCALESDSPIKRTEKNDYHLYLLSDAGFIKLIDTHMSWLQENSDKDRYPKSCAIALLTWKGHDFLDEIRSGYGSYKIVGDHLVRSRHA